MKSSSLLSLVLAIALVIVCGRNAFAKNENKEQKNMEQKENSTAQSSWNGGEQKSDYPFIQSETTVMVGTYDEQKNPDVMMAVATPKGNQITMHMSQHQTTENFEKTGGFTLAFITEGTVAESDYFGTTSEKKNPGKVKHVGFTWHDAKKVNAPVIDQYPLTLECKVVSWKDGVLVADIVDSDIDKSILDDKGSVDYAKLKPVVFDEGTHEYRVLGTAVGKVYGASMKFRK